MAPEVYSPRSDELNVIATDIYSLGMVMIVLACKSKLWAIPHITDSIFQVVYSPNHGLEALMNHWKKEIAPKHYYLFSKMCFLDPESRMSLADIIVELNP